MADPEGGESGHAPPSLIQGGQSRHVPRTDMPTCVHAYRLLLFGRRIPIPLVSHNALDMTRGICRNIMLACLVLKSRLNPAKTRLRTLAHNLLD